MAGEPLHGYGGGLVPNIDKAVCNLWSVKIFVVHRQVRTFASTENERFVCTAKAAPDNVVPARVSIVALHGLPTSQVDQLGSSTLQVCQKMSRVLADADRGQARLQVNRVFQGASDEVVHVNVVLIVHSHEPTPIGGNRQIFDPVIIGPVIFFISFEIVLAQAAGLV